MFLVFLAALLQGAHYYRLASPGLAVFFILFPLHLLWRRRWTLLVTQLFLLVSGLLWVQTTLDLVQLRLSLGLPWIRLAVILGGVSLFTAATALVFETRRLRHLFSGARDSGTASAGAFTLTLALLAVIQLKVPRPMLLLDRFFTGWGWLEALALAAYAAWVTEKMLEVQRSARWRRRIWGVFSLVFFLQLALGLMGQELFLMTPGKLHFPVPALIVAGPIFRGDRFFMLFLFLSSILLVGPAWCSHICYIGAWDEWAADRRRKPTALPPWKTPARVAILAAVILAALLLGRWHSVIWAGGLALAFGLTGVAVMLLSSRAKGTMVHCGLYCPVGLLASTLGRLSPFRLTIAEGCDSCRRCSITCRYDALSLEDIQRRRPSAACTLCGDCLASCSGGLMQYRFWGLGPVRARALFIVLVVTFHAVSLGVARL